MQTPFALGLLNAESPMPEGLIRPDGAPATKRYDVYRNNVVMSLIAALADGYPVCKKIVGEAFFDAMANVYVRENPPKSPLMIYYGDGFASFLDRFPPAKQVPYLADMARLEWARRIAYHAADDAPAELSALQEMSETELLATGFEFIASMGIIRSRYPVFDIFQFNMGERSDPPVPSAQSVMVLRPETQVAMHLLPGGADVMLETLQAGASLGTAIAKAQGAFDEFDAGAALSSVFAANAIKEVLPQSPIN